MHLKRLELAGFKSFAKPAVFEFRTPVTAVVGPNGSGKSNIAEGIRFVLGEQSMKSLRSKRGEDLIFNGSKTLARLNRASVSIVFDNSSRAFNIDYEEVEIKRVIHRDSTSEYFVNSTPVRLKDVMELLASLHIGASNHQIISQGQTDRILNASPEDRRSMVEDALGLKIYEYKRAESARKLRRTHENIAQVSALRKEIAPHIKFLEKQVERINQAEKLRDELKTLYADYLVREREYLRLQKHALGEEEKYPKEEIHAIEQKIRVLESELAKIEKKDGREHIELAETTQHLEDARGKKELLSRELGRLEGMIEIEERDLHYELESAKKDTYVTISRARFKDFKGSIDVLIAPVIASESFEELRSVLKIIQKELGGFIESVGAMEPPEIVEKRGMKEKGLSERKQELEKLRKDFDHATEEERRLSELYSKILDTLEQEKTNERASERELFTLKGRRSEFISRLELLKVRAERFRIEEEQYKTENMEAEAIVGKYILNTVIAEMPIPAVEETRLEQGKRRRAIERVKIKIEDAGGGGEEVLKEHREVTERDSYLARETEDLEKSALALGNLITELKEKIDVEFKVGVQKINKEFQHYFEVMFGGGQAAIKVVPIEVSKKKKDLLADISEDTDSPSEDDNSHDLEKDEDDPKIIGEGIEITITHPHKRIKGLQVLSGGERTLTSIALIFAMTQVNPPPFIVMDEADAALDETNSRKYGQLLEEISKTTQFIIITHNRETMAKASVLYGVTITADGASKLLSIKLGEAVELTDQTGQRAEE